MNPDASQVEEVAEARRWTRPRPAEDNDGDKRAVAEERAQSCCHVRICHGIRAKLEGDADAEAEAEDEADKGGGSV